MDFGGGEVSWSPTPQLLLIAYEYRQMLMSPVFYGSHIGDYSCFEFRSAMPSHAGNTASHPIPSVDGP